MKTFPSTTENQSKKKRGRIFTCLFFLLLIGLLLGFWRPWEQVKIINVRSIVVSEADVKKETGLVPGIYRWQVVGQELFLIHRLKEQNPKIAGAHIVMTGQQVLVTIDERVNAGFFWQKGQWHELDGKNHQFVVKAPDGSAPVYSGFKQSSLRNQVANSFTRLSYPVRHNISEIISSPDKNNSQRLIFIMNDGNTVYASSNSFVEKMAYYPSIVSQMDGKGIIDLQFGSYSYKYGAQNDNKEQASSDEYQQSSSQKNPN